MSETFSGLQYLTHDDCRLLKERSERKAFRAGETLIQQGTQTKLVYLLVSGMVRIDGPKGAIAYIGGGDICGEMAFLEDSLASATAVAEENGEAYLITWDALRALFDMFPHLGSRFHRSVARNLSRRLRQQIGTKKTTSKS
jgi:CRP-like cAMP-binding protein